MGGWTNLLHSWVISWVSCGRSCLSHYHRRALTRVALFARPRRLVMIHGNCRSVISIDLWGGCEGHIIRHCRCTHLVGNDALESHLALKHDKFVFEFGHFLRFYILFNLILDLLSIFTEEKGQLCLLRVVISWWDIHEHESLGITANWVSHQQGQFIISVRDVLVGWSFRQLSDYIFERHQTFIYLVGFFLLCNCRVRLLDSLGAGKIDKANLGWRSRVSIVVESVDNDGEDKVRATRVFIHGRTSGLTLAHAELIHLFCVF